MPKMIAVLRAVCALVLSGLGIVMAAHQAWVACVCIVIVAWANRPDVLRMRAKRG